jgi:hypothetical protein
MTKRLNKFLILLVFLLLLNLFSFLLALELDQKPDENRREVLETLKIFLADPEGNFSKIEKVDDLNYWTMIYELIEGENYVEELLSGQFKASDIDENRLNIICSLLLKYSFSPNPYDGPIAVIVDRLSDIMQSRPEWFFDNLVRQPEWKEIIRFIWAKNRDKLWENINGLKETNRKKELLQYLDYLKEELNEEYKWFELFLKEPGKYACEAKNIHNWGRIIGYYEQNHLDEKKTLLPKSNPILILSEWISDNTDETKIKVLLILLQHLTSGYHAEVISDLGAKLFIEHPQLFINGLKDHRHWKFLLFRISYDIYYNIYIKKKNLEDILRNIGSSRFEDEVREELSFMVGLVSEQIRKIERKTSF